MGFDIAGIGSAFDFGKALLDRIWKKGATETEKMEALLEMEKAISERDNQLQSAIIDAQKSVMVAELQQGDNYTKRARPTLIYGGLFVIFFNYGFVPVVYSWFGRESPVLEFPPDFWWAWSGACSAWVLGRSMERKGASNKLIEMLTGNKK